MRALRCPATTGQNPSPNPSGPKDRPKQRAAQVAGDAERYENPTQMARAVVGQEGIKLVNQNRQRAQGLRDRMATSNVPSQPGDENVDFDAIDRERADTQAANMVTQAIAPARTQSSYARELLRSQRAGIQGDIPQEEIKACFHDWIGRQ